MKSETKYCLSLMSRCQQATDLPLVARTSAGQEGVTAVPFEAQCLPTAFEECSATLLTPGCA